MKKWLKIVIGIVICIYLAIVVITTGFLLSKNDYGVSQFLGRNIIVIEKLNNTNKDILRPYNKIIKTELKK